MSDERWTLRIGMIRLRDDDQFTGCMDQGVLKRGRAW